VYPATRVVSILDPPAGAAAASDRLARAQRRVDDFGE